jgi:hypothetical protein
VSAGAWLFESFQWSNLQSSSEITENAKLRRVAARRDAIVASVVYTLKGWAAYDAER